jgi:hypothetical protein
MLPPGYRRAMALLDLANRIPGGLCRLALEA